MGKLISHCGPSVNLMRSHSSLLCLGCCFCHHHHSQSGPWGSVVPWLPPGVGVCLPWVARNHLGCAVCRAGAATQCIWAVHAHAPLSYQMPLMKHRFKINLWRISRWRQQSIKPSMRPFGEPTQCFCDAVLKPQAVLSDQLTHWSSGVRLPVLVWVFLKAEGPWGKDVDTSC